MCPFGAFWWDLPGFAPRLGPALLIEQVATDGQACDAQPYRHTGGDDGDHRPDSVVGRDGPVQVTADKRAVEGNGPLEFRHF